MAAVTEEEVVLLDMLVSPFGQRTRIALAEKGVAYECREEDLDNKSELLLKSNPVYKQIPVLIHRGKPICQSLLIVQYIDEVWPGGASLLPAEPYARARARARFWADYIDKTIYESGNKLWKLEGEAKEKATKEFVAILKLLEAELGEKKYFGGGDDGFGIVDIALLPFVSWFYAYETFGGFSIQAEAPLLVAWGKRCMERESVSRTLYDPQKLYELICYMKKKSEGAEQ